MKDTFTTFKVTALIGLLTAAGTVSAHTRELMHPMDNSSGSTTVYTKTASQIKGMEVDLPTLRRSFGVVEHANVTNDETSVLNVKFNEAESYTPQSLCLFNENGSYWLPWVEDDNTGVLEAPAGEYLLLAVTSQYNGSNQQYYYTVKDNVTVPGNFEVNPSESTSEIKMEGKNPEGETFRLDTFRIDGEDYSSYEIVEVEKGNVKSLIMRASILHEKYGEVFWNQLQGSANYEESLLMSEMKFDFKIFINPGVESVSVNLKAVGLNPGEVPCLASAIQKGTSSGVLTNDPDDYVDAIADFKQSGLGVKEMEKSGNPFPEDATYKLYVGGRYNGIPVDDLTLESDDMPGCSLRYCGPTSPDDPMKVQIYSSRVDCTVEYKEELVDMGDGNFATRLLVTTANAFGPKFGFNDSGELTIYPTTQDIYYGGFKSMPLEERVPSQFIQTVLQQKDPWGNTPVYLNTPVNTPINIENDHRFFVFTLAGNGYNGESNGTYGFYADYKVLYNGSDAGYDPEAYADPKTSGFTGWCIDRASEGIAPGVYDISFTVPQYIEEVEGSLSADIHFDLAADDCTPPSVQFFQLRDKNGNVRYNFDVPEDIVLNLAAGDFKWIDEPSRSLWADGGYVIPQAGGEVKVSYAPFGTENWTTITLEKTSDSYDCFAAGYTASIENLEQTWGAPGWFSVKIDLVDDSGNSCSQTVAPAFHVESLSGVGSAYVSNDGLKYADNMISVSDNSQIQVYDISGTVAANGKGCVSTAELAKGTYIAVAGGKSIKFVVK